MAAKNTAVQKQNKTVKQLLAQNDVKSRFQEILGKNAPQFMASILSALQTNPKLKEADPNSVLMSAAVAATLDLPINPNLGQAYMVPYNKTNSDRSKTVVAQFQMGYKGYIQLAQRSGQFQTISVTTVYEGQIKSNDPLRGMEFDWEAKSSNKVLGYAAFFKLLNGFEKTLYMTVDECKAHGKKYSRSYSKGLWSSDFDTMAQKTVLKLLLQKYAPLSVQTSAMSKALVADQGEIKDWEGNNVDYPDNEKPPVDIEAAQARQQRDRILDHIMHSKDAKELSMVADHLGNDEELTDAYNQKLNDLENQSK